MADIQGYCDPKFERAAQALVENIEAGREVGAGVFVSVDGETVIDIWGGWKDREHSAEWAEDTIVNVFSGSKTVTSLAVLMLVDRGEIDIDAPVADYWPEFAQNGKSGVLVRHLMSHTAGVSGWETPFSFVDAFDIETSTARLATQAPWWEPGSASAYHASTYGHLLAELVRRVASKTLPEFIATEIAGPLAADFYLGVPDSEFGRIATIYPVEDGPAPESAPKGEPSTPAEIVNAKTRAGSFSGTMGDPFTLHNSPEWWRTVFGGSSGHTNARGLGRIVTSLTNGGVSGGVQLLTPETIDKIFLEQANGIDMYYNKPIRWGVGYALASEDNKRGPLPFLEPGGRTAYWYGTGGSGAIADVDRGVTFAYAMNQCYAGRQQLNGSYYKSVYACL